MEIREDLVKLDKETKQIKVYGAKVVKAKQDRLGRVYIWVS